MNLPTLLEKTKQLFIRKFSTPCSGIASCPGRINILGEHTDYTGGLSIPAAINRWTLVAYGPAKRNKITFWSENFQDFYSPDLSNNNGPGKSWQKFLHATLKCLLLEFPLNKKKGVNLLIYGTVPLGKGLSSSASLELALLHALNSHFQLKLQDQEMVNLAKKIENDYLKVPSGFLDQYACQYSKTHKINKIDFENLTIESSEIEPLEGMVWVCIDSGIKRRLAASEYSTRVDQCFEFLKLVSSQFPSVKTFRDVESAHLDSIKDLTLKRRARHMLSENRRTQHGFHALIDGDWLELGRLLNKSHASLSQDYEVSCQELDFLQSTAVTHGACLGSRMMGGGFGGCTLNLVKAEIGTNFATDVTERYYKHCGIKADYYVLQMVEGARTHK